MAEIDQTANTDVSLCWGRGDDDARVFTVRKKDGSVEDISTWTLSMAVNTEKNPVDTVNEIFVVTGVLVDEGSGAGVTGKVSFTPPANSLDSVIVAPATTQKAFYGISRTVPSIKSLIKGSVLFIQDIDKSV